MCKSKNEICIKIISLVLSVALLVLSPYGKYIDTASIDKVNATSIAVVEGGTVAVEWLIAFFASLGLGSVAYEKREAIAQAYIELEKSKDTFNDKVNNAGWETCLQVYDSVDGTISNIPWQDFADSFQEGHDYVVDGLTDMYIKLCPELLGSFEDFVTSVINGDTYVEGLSDAIEEYAPVTSADIENQSSGNLYTVSAFGHIGGSSDGCSICKSLSVEASHQYTSINGDVTGRYAFVYDTSYLMGYNAGYGYRVDLRNKDGTCYLPTYFTYSCGNTKERGTSTIVCDSFSANIPIFTNSVAAKSYILSGEGFESALNYGHSWDETITDNNDLPPFYKTWQQQLWEQIANAPDVGIGSYGGALVNDWATDLPFIGLGALEDYITSVQDVFEKTIDDIIDGVYDPTLDIPTTYDRAWEDAIERTWEDVIEDSKEKTQEKENTGEKEEEKTDEKEEEKTDEKEIDDPPGVESDSGPFIADLSKFFPFCIPFDLIHLLSVLDAEPETPRWEISFKIPAYGVDETIVIDLSAFDGVAKIVRLCETILFIFSLILATRGLIKG